MVKKIIAMHLPMVLIIICIKIRHTKPALLNRFKPWYPFLWTDGSIGAISTRVLLRMN